MINAAEFRDAMLAGLKDNTRKQDFGQIGMRAAAEVDAKGSVIALFINDLSRGTYPTVEEVRYALEEIFGGCSTTGVDRADGPDESVVVLMDFRSDEIEVIDEPSPQNDAEEGVEDSPEESTPDPS